MLLRVKETCVRMRNLNGLGVEIVVFTIAERRGCIIERVRQKFV